MTKSTQPRSGGMFKKRTGDLLRVREGRMLHWPRRSIRGGPQARGGPGYIVWKDDPLLDTRKLDPAFRDQHGINPDDNQMEKLEPAPEGSVISGHQNKGAHELYTLLQYTRIPYGYSDPEEGFVATNTRPSPTHQETEVEVPKVDGE